MLYSEFIEGTGCKDTQFNYGVYKNLEIMYMNSDMSKAEIYEYGKKLVDNSKTEAELEAEARVTAEINDLKADNESRKAHIESRKADIEREKVWLRDETDKGMIRWIENNIRWYREDIRQNRQWIKSNNTKIRSIKAIFG